MNFIKNLIKNNSYVILLLVVAWACGMAVIWRFSTLP